MDSIFSTVELKEKLVPHEKSHITQNEKNRHNDIEQKKHSGTAKGTVK